ncbi:hypothetical protein O6H91_24G006400 [Diphasiastrum complanatum]|uniref:Uncharacterized protein n=3 Tax=Diphasiastrum complanatum TaxID=34168 RepID=A0ACC2A795_DIPCM|nr:hypothetical protein O6H91_24G006400 [Diphasiastrum complanatum]KAJ7513415.1 hypothetical protein O6H91_24G006400 [Diphasiastrum complanatum]KAJ7513416.1 hypothetical protein O6H91_24G006400 [Diphasiastrum complanatum]
MKLKRNSNTEGTHISGADGRDACPSAQLSSPDKETRERGLALLETWLSRRKEINDKDMKKIWQDLLYCLWHAGSRAWQVYLTKRIASVLGIIHPSMSIPFFRAFLCTLRSKWDGMETGKIDRFYFLLQTCLSEMFRFLQRECWKKESIKKFNECFLETVLMQTDSQSAHGISLYLSQVFLDELRKFLPLSSLSFRLMLEPFWKVFATVEDEVLLRRVRDSVFLPLMEEAQSIQGDEEDNEGSMNYLAFNLLFVQRIFKLATSPTTCEISRNLIHQLHEDYCKAAPIFPVNAASPTTEIVSTNASNDASNSFAILNYGNASDETDVLLRSSEIGFKEVPQWPASRDSQINLPEVLNEDNSGKEYLMQGIKNPLPKELLSSDDRVPFLELLNAARKDGDRNSNQAKSFTRNKRKRKKAAADLENGGSRSLKRRRLLKSFESNSHVVNRKYLQEICNRLDGAASGGTGGENAKDEKLAGLETTFIYIKEGNETMSFSSPMASFMLAPSPINTGSKRKKCRKLDEGSSMSENANDITNLAVANSRLSEENIKRVTFSLQDNIVWQPHMPLPPKALRVPPSAMPRGSALKKGVPPGPIYVPRPRKCSPRNPLPRKRTKKNSLRDRKWKFCKQ